MYVYVYRGLSVLFAFHSALLTEAGRCWASLLDHLHFIWKEAGRSALEETDCVDFARQNFLSSRSLERLDSYNQSGAAAFWEPRLTMTQSLLPTSPTFPGSEAARGVHCSVSGTQALHTHLCVCVCNPSSTTSPTEAVGGLGDVCLVFVLCCLRFLRERSKQKMCTLQFTADQAFALRAPSLTKRKTYLPYF